MSGRSWTKEPAYAGFFFAGAVEPLGVLAPSAEGSATTLDLAFTLLTLVLRLIT